MLSSLAGKTGEARLSWEHVPREPRRNLLCFSGYGGLGGWSARGFAPLPGSLPVPPALSPVRVLDVSRPPQQGFQDSSLYSVQPISLGQALASRATKCCGILPSP